ncbi:flavodoxin domain-containing protein [Dactylosporangium sp. NPDC051484]|uniref:flavodoxin domain-containing protein n=1 Tax=Dactylosporangium sp. NPDC051484 TaxID=3154942 RepID=UPI00344C61E5
MRVLVTAASKHGSTAEMAELIGSVLAGHGLEVRVSAPGDIADTDELDGYDAVVLGSAVYAGHWLGAALRFAARHAAALAARPVWLFSSGPIGDPPIPAGDAVDVASVVAAAVPVEHRVFPGAMVRSRLGYAERALIAALRAPYGDFRDWAAVRRWAHDIGAALTGTADAGPTPPQAGSTVSGPGA